MTPEEYLVSKSSGTGEFDGAATYLEAKKPGILKEIGIRLGKSSRQYEAGLRAFTEAFTGGFTDKSDIAGSYIANKILGGDKSFVDVQAEKDMRMKALIDESPGTAALATLTGYASPLGAFSGGTKLVSKIPLINKLLGATKIVRGVEKPQFWKPLIGSAMRGGTTMAGIGQVEEDLPSSMGDIPENIEKRVKRIPGDFGTGVAFDSGIYALGRAAQPVARVAKKIWKKGTEKIPFGIGDEIKEARANKFEAKVEDVAKSKGVEDPLISGRDAAEGGAKIQKEASNRYFKLKNAMLKKFGRGKASPEVLRQGINDELKQITELAADLDPEAKALKPVLEKWQAKLYSNPTLQELDDITTTLYRLKQKPNANPSFERLYKAARENLLTAMDDAAEAAGRRTGSYKAAVKESGRLAQTQTDLMTEAKQPLKGERQLKEIAETQKGVTERQQDIDDIIAGLDSANEMQGAQAREAYRAARQDIAKNVSVKEGPVGKLIEHGKEFPSEVPEKARTLGRLDLPEVVDEAIGVNPAYRDSMRKAVLSDIIDHAKNEKTFQAWLGKYKRTIPKLFSADEIKMIEGAAGLGNKEVGWLKRMTGVGKETDIAEILPRALAPLMREKQTRVE